MMSKNNSCITKRRKFLTMFLGTTIGFSISFLKNINSVIAQKILWNYLFSLSLPASGLILAAFVKLSFKQSNKQSKLSKAQFKYEIEIDEPPLDTNTNFDIEFDIDIEDENGNRLSGTTVRTTISLNETKYWSYKYTWKGNAYNSPLYLVITSGDEQERKQFY
ncbi:MAG: hypothetical protein HEQ35_22270 [Gloeotrichia echinulata IR180]